MSVLSGGRMCVELGEGKTKTCFRETASTPRAGQGAVCGVSGQQGEQTCPNTAAQSEVKGHPLKGS